MNVHSKNDIKGLLPNIWDSAPFLVHQQKTDHTPFSGEGRKQQAPL